MVISLTALFVALSGTALALSRNSVGPRELQPNAVRSAHVKSNTITGQDVRELSLGTVRRARNANALGGAKACRSFALEIDGASAERNICEAGANRLLASCLPFGGGVRVEVSKDIGGVFTLLSTSNDTPGGGPGMGSFVADEFIQGSNGGGIIASFFAEANATAVGVGTCEFHVLGATY